MKVSVIIPTYNRAGYLTQALQSIFDQSIRPYEVVVADDGSIDSTQELLCSYGSKVRYVRQEHRGVAAARNLGLQAAEGDIIAWLDADDLWEPNFLEMTVSLLEANQALDGVYTGISYIDATGGALPQTNLRVVPAQDLYSSLLEDDFVVTPAVVVRKRCFAQVGDFDTQFSICEDYDMWLRLARAFTMVGIPQALVKVRVHAHNTLGDKDKLIYYRVLLAQKHFGPLGGDPAAWSEEKRRAYAYAFRTAAMVSVESGHKEQGWQYLEKAVTIEPNLLARLDTFYELAYGAQPRGYRGQADMIDVQRNGAELLDQLDILFVQAGPQLESMKSTAYGNACLALGMLSDQAGDWGSARHYLFKALRHNPRLGANYLFVRRLLKVMAGRRFVGTWRQIHKV